MFLKKSKEMTVRKYILYRLHRLAANRLSPLPLPRRASSRAHALRTVRSFSVARCCEAPLRCAVGLARTRGAQQRKHPYFPTEWASAHEFQFSCSGDSEAAAVAADAVFGFLVCFFFGFQFEEVAARSIWSTSSPSWHPHILSLLLVPHVISSNYSSLSLSLSSSTMGVLVKEKLQLQQQQQQAGGSVMLKDQAQCRRGGRGRGGGEGGGGVGLTTFMQLELAGEPPLPCGWEKCLDLQVCMCACVFVAVYWISFQHVCWKLGVLFMWLILLLFFFFGVLLLLEDCCIMHGFKYAAIWFRISNHELDALKLWICTVCCNFGFCFAVWSHLLQRLEHRDASV